MAPPVSLMARALGWLAQREHSRIELRRKLLAAARRRDSARAGTADPAAEVDALLDWLTAERHLSDARFIESRVHARATRFGRQRIAHELKQHGAALDAQTAESLRRSELDRARTVWAKKFGGAAAAPADARERVRQMRFLAGRGFAADVIRRVVRGGGTDDD
jgi:regulatory protein